MDEIRAPNYELALLDYQSGMKYKDIAEKYNVTINTVKSWKTRYRWSKDKKKSVHTKSEKVCTQKGGQPGNKNAIGNKGGAAPEKNKNAVKTGEFEALFFDALEEDEKQLISMVQLDKEQLLLQEIQLLTVRERRMLKRIEDIKQAAADQIESDAPGMTAVKYRIGIDENTTEYTGALGQIQSVEDALTRVQARKQKAIDSLHRYGYDDARLELEMMKVELEIMKQDNPDPETEDDGFMKAMNGIASDVWEETDE
ncbi:phage terminase small subunit [Lachnospiraceae bacterium 54-53]